MLLGCPLTDLGAPGAAPSDDVPAAAPDVSARLRALEDPSLQGLVPDAYEPLAPSHPDAQRTARRVVDDIARRAGLDADLDMVSVESVRSGVARGRAVTELVARCVLRSGFYEFALLARVVERDGALAYVNAGRTDDARFQMRELSDDLQFVDVWAQTRAPALFDDALTRLERVFAGTGAPPSV
jgi:hypothetical protein